MAITHALVADGTPLVAAGDWNDNHVVPTVDITLAAWPIGSVFIAVVSTSPATLLGGGTWSAIAAGRMLIGLDSGDVTMDTAEELGGEKTHTLTAAEMPVHGHTQDSHNHTQNSHNHIQDAHLHTIGTGTTDGTPGIDSATTSATNRNSGSTTATNQVATATNQAATATNQNAGSGSAHNNLPPFFVVYMWKRTA